MRLWEKARQVATLCVVALACGLPACGPTPVVTPSAPASFDQKVGWILRLENQRVLRDSGSELVEAGSAEEVGTPVVAPTGPDLVALLSDPEPQIRRRAALAIGRVGLREGVEPLVAALADPEVEVRQMAAFGLGLIGDSTASGGLHAALQDAAPLVQGRAAEALGRIGAVDSAAAIGEVASRHLTAALALQPDDMSYPFPAGAAAFRLAVCALGNLGAYESLASVVLQEDGQPVLWWWPVAYALRRTGDPRALPALITLAGVQGTYAVALAAEGLGELGRSDDRALDALVALLDRRSRDDLVVAAAVRALGRFDDPRAAGALRAMVLERDASTALRLDALDGLGAQSSSSAVDLFVELISARQPSMRGAALRGLARSDPGTFLLALSSLEPDREWSVRAARADGLAYVDPLAGEYQLRLMLQDEDARVLPHVLRSLASIEASDLGSILVGYLSHDDVSVRATAARLLTDIETSAGGMEVTSALVAAYEAARADASHVARIALVDALATRPGAEARATLERALEDAEWPVRLRAVGHLEELGADPVMLARARPAPGRRSVDFTALTLVRPSVSPHVFIETPHGVIELELNVIETPVVSDNFVTLVRRGFYDGLPFQRSESDRVLQAGDPRGDTSGGPGYTLRDELGQAPILRGTVGLVSDGPDAGGSQFFIAQSPQPQRDGRATAFAKVVSGMDVVDRLASGDEIQRAWAWDGASLTTR